MTRVERENVLHCLKVMIDEEVCEECNLYGTTGTDHCEADCVRMAIKLLEQEPTTKNDLGVDCVSREKVLKLIYDYKENHSNDREHYPINYGTLLDMIRWVRDLPSVTPQEPKTGHWIMTGDYYTGAYGTIDYVECSCCHEYSLEEGNYCPNCGAKMVEPQESEDEK